MYRNFESSNSDDCEEVFYDACEEVNSDAGPDEIWDENEMRGVISCKWFSILLYAFVKTTSSKVWQTLTIPSQGVIEINFDKVQNYIFFHYLRVVSDRF